MAIVMLLMGLGKGKNILQEQCSQEWRNKRRVMEARKRSEKTVLKCLDHRSYMGMDI